jgi:PAS domain S-box-containing protein
MALFVLASSTLLLALAMFESLRLVRRTGQGLPWVLLSVALALMISGRLVSLSGEPHLAQELMALIIALVMLLAVGSMGRVIDELARVQRARELTEESYRALVANLPMISAVLDSVGTLTILNPALALTLTGYAPEEIAAPSAWRGLVHALDLPGVEAALLRALGGETVHLLLRFRHRDGNWKSAGCVFYPRWQGSRVTGVNALASDVTERLQLEEQLRHAQKMEALGAMGGGIAHDFNNLLSSILGNIELAGRKLSDGHPAQKNLEDAARTALRASEHTRQLLGFSRRTVQNPRRLSLNDVCHEAVELVRPAVDPRIEFRVRAQVGLWDVNGDPGELVQILVNLFLNARDVLPQGGEIVVETSNEVVDEMYMRQHAEGRTGEFVCLAVSDNGPGMIPAVRARIFEPFFTTKPPGQGTGLGLAMVYGTVRSHGGWIGCYSALGEGTRFAIHLPRATQLSSVEPAPAPSEEAPRGSETILLVDDDDDLRRVGVEVLQELGYSVLEARDGIEGMHVFAERHSSIALVLLDLSMPRLNGRDTLASMRQLDPDVPVLLTSGHSLDAESRALLELGASGFVEKPYRLVVLGHALRGVLDAAPQRLPR